MQDLLWEQRIKIAALRKQFFDALDASGERDVSIVIAALTETLGTVSDWNLQAERDLQKSESQ